jgi:biotin carboxylase
LTEAAAASRRPKRDESARTILFLGASVSQLPAIRKARALGLRTVAVDGDPDAVAFAEVDVAETIDFSDVDAVVASARRQGVDGVVAISTDRAVPVAAAVSEALGLPGVDATAAQRMTHKGMMRQRLAEAGIPQPRFTLAGTSDDPASVLAKVGAPAVVKPVDSGGQRGVFFVETAEQLAEALPRSLEFTRVGLAIVERFVPGSELNVMAIVAEGTPYVLTLSDRLRPNGPGFGVGWAHLFPCRFPAVLCERAADVARGAITALGLQDGIAFPQLMVTEDDVLVVEVAARIAAGQMADLVRYGIGIDLVEVAFAQALGNPLRPELVTPRFAQPLAIRFLTADPGPLPKGRLLSVAGLDRVLEAPGVIDAGLYLQPGELINSVQVDADRRGYVIATGTTPAKALELADQAIWRLKVEVE